MSDYIHDEWCDLDETGECDCVVKILEAKDAEIAALQAEIVALRADARLTRKMRGE
jgi:hypothetical protein